MLPYNWSWSNLDLTKRLSRPKLTWVPLEDLFMWNPRKLIFQNFLVNTVFSAPLYLTIWEVQDFSFVIPSDRNYQSLSRILTETLQYCIDSFVCLQSHIVLSKGCIEVSRHWLVSTDRKDCTIKSSVDSNISRINLFSKFTCKEDTFVKWSN